LQLPGAGKPAPDRGNGLPTDPQPTAVGYHVELGNLPGQARGDRAANEGEPGDLAAVPDEERVTAGLGEVRIEIRIAARVCGAGREVPVVREFVKVPVEERGDDLR